MKQISLGTGILTWNKSERITDRYGAVYLMEDGRTSFTAGPSPSVVNAEAVALNGRDGKLTARVISPRTSTHIGDLFRGLAPRTPEVGTLLHLGEGLFFT